MNYLQLTLDISKSSTGVTISLIKLEGNYADPVAMTSGKIGEPSNKQYITKNYHLAARCLLKELTGIVDEFKKKHNVPEDIQKWCIYEYPIFDGTSASLQFYLHQTVQEYLDLNGYEAIGVSTGLVKSYANSVRGEKKSMKESDKSSMKECYQYMEDNKYLPTGYPLTRSLTSSDEVDALFISMLGMHMIPAVCKNAHNLGEALFDYITRPEITADQVEFYSEVWRNMFLAGRTTPILPEQWRLSNPYMEVHKQTLTKIRANFGLSLSKSKLTHPYGTLQKVSARLNAYLAGTGMDYKTLYKDVVSRKILFSQSSKDRFLETGEIDLQLDHAGSVHSVSKYSTKLNHSA